ncbi:MAG: hypothetical protein ACTSO7_01090 [Candidatus Heimdallarchaeota archaeon]
MSTPILTVESNYEFYWATDLSDKTMTIDGSLDDWAGVYNDTTLGMTYFIGYDEANVYVAVTWFDNAYENDISVWNKTGMLGPDEASWDLLDGEDDRITVGFSNGTSSDVWVWTASERTHSNYAYEINETGAPDSGDLPYILNTNGTVLEGNYKPIYNSTQQPITDYNTIPNGTEINAWFGQTPTGSQADVNVAYSYDPGMDIYIVEFSRAINTGNPDDIVLNLKNLTGIHFMIGIGNGETAVDFDFGLIHIIDTKEWYDITSTIEVNLSGKGTITYVGSENGTDVDEVEEIDSNVWDFSGDSFPEYATAFVIIGGLISILAVIMFVAGKKTLIMLIAASIGVLAGSVSLIGTLLYLNWTNWLTNNIATVYEQIESGFTALTSSSLNIGFYTPLFFGAIFIVATLLLLTLSLIEFVRERKKRKEE